MVLLPFDREAFICGFGGIIVKTSNFGADFFPSGDSKKKCGGFDHNWLCAMGRARGSSTLIAAS